MTKPNESEIKPSQLQKFQEAARELETDDREESLDRHIRQVAKAVVPPKEVKPKKAGKR